MKRIFKEQADPIRLEWLNSYLADLWVFFIELHNVHWNMMGTGFLEAHETVADIYEMIGGRIDTVGERVKQLGGLPTACLSSIMDRKQIDTTESREMDVKSGLGYVISSLVYLVELDTEGIKLFEETYDQGTMDIFIKAVGEDDKFRWLLESEM